MVDRTMMCLPAAVTYVAFVCCRVCIRMESVAWMYRHCILCASTCVARIGQRSMCVDEMCGVDKLPRSQNQSATLEEPAEAGHVGICVLARTLTPFCLCSLCLCVSFLAPVPQ